MRLGHLRKEIVRGAFRDAGAQAVEEAGFVGSGLRLAEDAAQRGPGQQVGNAGVTGDARGGVVVGARPGKPLLLARVEVVGGGAGVPVGGERGEHGDDTQEESARPHMGTSIVGRDATNEVEPP